MPRLSHKATQLLWATLKILIVVLAGYFIYSKLNRSALINLQFQLSEINTSLLYFYIIIVLLFTVANWFFEFKKWQVLVGYFSQLSFRESVQQTLTAHLAGFVTPAKAGDYGAKALYYPKEQRKKTLFLNFIGNMYQLLVTLVVGFVGLGILALFTSGTAIFFWGLSIFMTLVLYQILPKVLKRFNWSLKGNAWYKIKSFWKAIPKDIKRKTRLYSFIRYAIFAHQFYIILLMLGADIPYVFAMSCIAAMYILSSVIPVMQLLDVLVRGGVAVLVFGWYFVPEEIVLSTVLIMWLCNVVLPLLPGAIYLFKNKKRSSVAL
ncbi:lysylphosphatidylglycerol synthase domain-containing protein [Dokdonia sp. Asnod1-B02]|uniref:lysylphosphatidylglycerol synthase domain-containing protein n=1 Tax=Dokdonia sp. Asnod1-B02 TaxID=3160573 RepID=UPI003866970E